MSHQLASAAPSLLTPEHRDANKPQQLQHPNSQNQQQISAIPDKRHNAAAQHQLQDVNSHKTSQFRAGSKAITRVGLGIATCH